MSTVFEIRPDDYSNITFNVIRPEGSEDGYTQSNYNVLLSSIALNEEARIQFEYAQYQHREGGEVRDTRYPLVPITFTVRVVGLGATSPIRKEDLLEQCSDLMRAIYNSNGYLKYKPDGLGATVLDTYYRYIQSVPPRPLMGEKEYWGRSRMAGGDAVYVEGYPSRQFEITLMTQPIAMSDPDNPYEVLSATTLKNIGDGGAEDNLTIVAATVKGSVPATTRIIAHPLTAGADAAIGTLWVAKRTSGLGSFVSTYLTATHQAPTGVWSTEGDAARCGNTYYRCTPAANNTVYATRYTISNWASHKGRAAILMVARNNGTEATDFDVYYRWAIANYPLTGEKKQLSQVESWEPLLLGEIDLPETEMSSQEELDLYIDICVVRTAGSGTFDVDGIKLLYTDEAAIQVDMPSGTGASTVHSFLLENFDEEIAHAIVHATDKLAYICNPYGDFITLEPDVSNRLDVAWERYNLLDTPLEDDFSGYGNYWEKIADFEDGDWVFTSGDGSLLPQSSYAQMEGEYNIHGGHAVGNNVVAHLDVSLDLSDVSSGDWICMAFWHSRDNAEVELRFYSTVATDYYTSGVETPSGPSQTWDQFMVKKSGFSAVGAPDWSAIVRIEVEFGHPTLVGGCRLDDLRVSSSDPDDANDFDETNGVWDREAGDWHVEDLTGTNKVMGSMDSMTLHSKTVLLLSTDYGGDIKYRAKVHARDSNRDGAYEMVGLLFRYDYNGGNDNGYGLYLKFDDDEIELRQYLNGVHSDVAEVAYICSEDTNYYLGVIAKGTSVQCFVSTALADLWNIANRKINVTATAHSAGLCGLASVDCNGRFTDVKLEMTKDLHIPGDEIQLSAFSLFRTIYPFHEDAP